MVKIASNIDAYLATPSGDNAHKDKAILYLPDVLGIWQNAQLIADQYAANGYTTLLVDLFNGDPVSVNEFGKIDIMKWLAEGSDGKNPHTKEVVDGIVEAAIKHMKEEMGIKKIGAVGYCFGAKVCLPRFSVFSMPVVTDSRHSTLSVTTRTVSTLATSPTRLSWTRMSLPPSAAPSPLPLPRRTPFSRLRSATSPRRFSRRLASLTRSSSTVRPRTVLPFVATCL